MTSENTFQPAWWAPGAHCQTILGRFLRMTRTLPFERTRLETADGDFLDLDIARPENGAQAPVVIILHGLEGSSEAPYVNSLAAAARDRGWIAAAVNFRGCSFDKLKSGKRFRARVPVPNLLAATYHSGKTEDLDLVLAHLRKTEGARPFFAAGFSLGGNILLKWLGEKSSGAGAFLERAAAVSVPYDLVESVKMMDRGFNREVYTRVLLSTLKKKALLKADQYPGLIDKARVKSCRTFREFDREVTARLNGFQDEVEYWTLSSSGRYLKEIRIPSLLVHAEDDPFFPGKYLPYEIIRESPHLNLCLSKRGGHVGFLSGRFPQMQEQWLEETVLDFFTGRSNETKTQRVL